MSHLPYIRPHMFQIGLHLLHIQSAPLDNGHRKGQTQFDLLGSEFDLL